MSHIPLSETYLVETTWTVLRADPGYRDETPMINHLHIHRFIDTINCRAAHFFGTRAPSGPGPPHCRGFTVTHRHHTR